MNEDIAAGEALRDEAIGRAAKRAKGEDSTFPDQALECVRHWAEAHTKFTTESVISTALTAGISTPEPRAWGSVMRRAMLRGMIRFSHYEKSKNPQAHRRPVAVWQSLIYKGPPPIALP